MKLPNIPLVDIDESQLTFTFDLCKAEISSPLKSSIPLSVPGRSMPQQTYWHVELEPRDYKGRWTRGGKSPQDIKKEFKTTPEAITRIKAGSIVMIKETTGAEQGTMAKIIKVIGRDMYQIRMGIAGTGATKEVTKANLIKPHYHAGGKARDIKSALKTQPKAQIQQQHYTDPKYMDKIRQEAVNQQFAKHKAQIDELAAIYYNTYKSKGIDLNTMGISKQDLEQEARLAFLKAATHHDPKKGDLWEFAKYNMETALKRAIMHKTSTWGTFRMPEQERLRLSKVKQYQRHILQTENRTPDKAESKQWLMTNIAGMTETEAQAILNLPTEVYSLQSTGTDEEGNETELLYRLKDPTQDVEAEAMAEIRYKEIVSSIESKLEPITAKVIILKFDLSPDHAGEQLASNEIQKVLRSQGIDIADRTIRDHIQTGIDILKQDQTLLALLQNKAIPSQSESPEHIIIAD